MNRFRIVPAAMLLGAVGLGLAFLMAAKEADGTAKDPAAPKSAEANTKLVCIGYADTEERIVQLFPKNFPQPSVVKEVKVKEGALVEADQELLTFDDAMYKLKIEQAELAIGIAKAKQAEAEVGVKAHAAQANVMYKEVKAAEENVTNKRSEWEETKRLVGGISTQKLNADEAAVREGELKLEAAKLKYEAFLKLPPTELVDTAKANVKMAENAKQQAEQALKDQCCKAPAKGQILRSFVSDGTIFGPASREPAFWFLKNSDIVIRAEVTQEFARNVVVGQAATVADEADAQQTWKGKVSKVGAQFLTKRTGHSPMELMNVSDDRVLECIIALEKSNDVKPPRYGQKVRIKLAD